MQQTAQVNAARLEVMEKAAEQNTQAMLLQFQHANERQQAIDARRDSEAAAARQEAAEARQEAAEARQTATTMIQMMQALTQAAISKPPGQSS